MGRTKSILGILDTYMDFYSYVSKGKRSPQDVTTYLQSKNKGASTATEHVKTAKAGKLKYISFEDDKFSLDCAGLAQELTSLLSQMHLDVFIEEKKAKPEAQIPTITTGKSPNFESLNKDKNAANAKCRKLEKELAAKNAEIAELKKKVSQSACNTILSDMDKKILIPATVASDPPQILARDFFKESPGADISFTKYASKSAGETEADSLYEQTMEPEKALTVRNVIQRVCNQFKDGRVFKSLLKRNEPESKAEGQQDDERSMAIRMLLENSEMDNQTKLSTYALWYFHGDSEMESLLTYAGEHCIEANYLIQLLEQPKEHQNYRTIRAFLRQAMSASEARIKKQTVKELLCGDWQAVANYCGKTCHFKLVPVEEIQAFRNLLLKNDQMGAACETCKMLKTTFSPMDQKLEGSVSEAEKPQIESPDFLHEADGDVDIHVQVDEDAIWNDFAEEEADGNGQ